jgi:uncharacterized protein with NAD-binding domain and iron-sulfur cluster
VTKARIVILGGGVGAVTAAYFLSGCEQVTTRYDIVLYQQGWRLGGKGASGRTADGHRIEEHGLHVWFGYYENAFRMLRDCHEELDRLAKTKGDPRWSSTMHSIEEAFRPISSIGILENEPSGSPWIATFPEDDKSPWDRDLLSEPTTWDARWYLTTLLTRSITLMAAVLRSAGDEVDLPESSVEPVDGPGVLEELIVGLGQRLNDQAHLVAGPLELLAAFVTSRIEIIASGSDGELYDIAQDVLTAGGRLLDALRLRIDEQLMVNRASVRRLWSLADVFMAIVRGLLYHRVSSEEDFEDLDEFEFRTWLRMHGALAESTTSALVRTVAYDLPFAYQSGDPDLAACGAGTALRTLFRAFFTYRGAIMWKMNAGMGDVVFAPLYELLHKRGVQFEFFRQVKEVVADGDRVTRIRMRVQGEDPNVKTPENRLIAVPVAEGGLMRPGHLRCWPSVPAGKTQGEAEALEAWWGIPPEAASTEDDVELDPADHVVFGLPLTLVKHVAPSLMKTRREWRDLVAKLKTTATQAMQIWVIRPAADLGWFSDAVVGGYDAPYDTFSDMPELRFQEGTKAATVLYLCAVLPDGPAGEEQEQRSTRSPGWNSAKPMSERSPTISRPSGSRTCGREHEIRPQASTTARSRWRGMCAATSSRPTGTCFPCPAP